MIRDQHWQEVCNMFGIEGFCRAYRSLVTKRHPENNPSSNKAKPEAEDNFKSIDETIKVDTFTFEGVGNERLETQPADIIFVIAERRHTMYRREGEDLELAVEIPLVKALTGCTLSVPLLGGEKMSLTIDNIIPPAYVKIIAGQGMPKSKEQGNRGNLIIKFLVQFPAQPYYDG